MAKALFALLLIFCCTSSYATSLQYATSINGSIKHPQDFAHFESVNPDAPRGGELRLNSFANFYSINPHNDKYKYSQDFESYLVESLMVSSPDEMGVLYCHICKNFQILDQGKTIRYFLKPHVHFSDGSPLSAHSVVASFNAIAKGGTIIDRMYYADIKEVKAISEYQVDFHLNKATYLNFIITASLPLIKVDDLPVEDLTKYDGPLTSTAPYKVERYQFNRFLRLVRDPNYWGNNEATAKGLNNFDYIHYTFISDPNAAMEAFLGKAYDIKDESYSLKNWKFNYTKKAAQDPSLIMVERDAQMNVMPLFLTPNSQGQFTRDHSMRFAIAMAMDTDFYIQKFLFNLAKPADSIFITTPHYNPQLNKGYYLNQSNASWPKQREQLEAAKQALFKEGYYYADRALYKDGERVKLNMLIASPGFYRIAQILINNLNLLGIELVVRTHDQTTYTKLIDEGQYDLIFSGGLSFFYSGINERRVFGKNNIGDGKYNFSRVSDDKIEQLLNRIEYAKGKQLEQVSAEFNNYVLSQYYVIPTYYNDKLLYSYWDKFSTPDVQSPYNINYRSWWTKY